ncbi:MFS transporter [Lentilactobacillus sp. IMAU92037]|uniref:MFS transporter n=1 Tax=Lentilactobacillus TaxID=2767893 RepID=UPI001C2C3961|nr:MULTISPECIES: MFS transporter [Lentilactobacillus]MBV0931038.1 MFS transporter [Lentilactobacillus dabitei]MDM7516652.1 MFS transporter [Lentilactobacillus sp. TOM.63]
MNKIKYVLPVLLIGNLLCMMDVSIMTIVLPEIQTAFNESLTNLSWTLNVYTIVFASFIIPFGRLAEKFGRNKFVFTGLIIFAGGSLLSGISTNLSFMLVARGIQSIGAAMIIPTSMVIGLELSNQQNRNKIVAALAGVQGLAVALGPSIGGFVAQYWGWRWVFFINVPLIVIDLIVFPMVLSLRHEQTQSAPIDWTGALLSVVMLFSLSLGLIKGNTWGWDSPIILGLFATAFVSLPLFILLERKLKLPMINMNLFHSRNFNGASISLVLCNFFLGGMAVLIPTFLTRVHGQSELGAALLITPYSVAVMFSVIITSLLVKKINNKLLIGLGFTLIGISYYLLANMDLSQNYNQLIIAAILLGVGYGLVAATANILAVADFHGSILTASQSVANVLRQVGMVLAIAVFMTVLSTNIDTAKQRTLNYGESQISMLNSTAALKSKLQRKIHSKLNPNSTNVTKVKGSLKFKGAKISQAKRSALISQSNGHELALIATKEKLPVKAIPAKLKSQVLKNVSATVNQTITRKENDLDHQLKTLIARIKQQLKAHLNHAFLSVYANLIWLPFLSLLVIPIFDFKTHQKI